MESACNSGKKKWQHAASYGGRALFELTAAHVVRYARLAQHDAPKALPRGALDQLKRRARERLLLLLGGRGRVRRVLAAGLGALAVLGGGLRLLLLLGGAALGVLLLARGGALDRLLGGARLGVLCFGWV